MSSTMSNTQPGRGNVSKLRANWSVYEDGALAERLQSEEIQDHLSGNRMRNHQIRDDFPRALEEQSREVESACRQAEERRRALRSIESNDAEVAMQMQTRANIVRTPSLPVMEDGDVPTSEDTLQTRRIVYNDEQYQVKLARPALVKDEPLYANNQPEHYAVSTKYPTGAISKIPAVSPRKLAADDVDTLVGISQKDVSMSRRVEEMLAQERSDEELAKRLQEQLAMADDDDSRLAIETRDHEYAKMLYEREQTKLKRAKERARLKKQRKREEEEARKAAENSQQQVSEDFVEDVRPPARRPYMNTGAIDNHMSACNYDNVDDKDTVVDIVEPQYANVIPAASAAMPEERFASNLDADGVPIPPYMPMQKTMSKKSSSMEKRIKKKKEKEGCKQQ